MPDKNHRQVWDVTIGTVVLQTLFSKHLRSEFIGSFPGGVAIAYAAILVIPTLPEPLTLKSRATSPTDSSSSGRYAALDFFFFYVGFASAHPG